MEYKRISRGFWDYALYPKSVDIDGLIHTFGQDKDYYISIYNYTESHYSKFINSLKMACEYTNTDFDESNLINIVSNVRRELNFKIDREKDAEASKLLQNISVAGTTDIKTDKLVFDFDCKDDPEIARRDTIELVSRLLSKGLNKDEIQLSFSGNKGFSLEVETNESFSRKEFENIVTKLSEGLKSFDSKVSDEQRLFRIPLTIHNSSKLYKIPITIDQLSTCSMDQIKKLAEIKKVRSDMDNYYDLMQKWELSTLPESIKQLKKVEDKKLSEITFEDRLELSRKPNWLSSTKFALQEGFFKEGERHHAFMILAATYKSHGFPAEIAWRMLKGVAELQAKRNGGDEYSEKLLWSQIIKSVYGDNWNGGTYSEKETTLLKETASRFNLELNNSDIKPKTLTDVTNKFKDFVKNIEQNTIKTGIKQLDDNIFLSTGANVSILGAPGSGKSSIALEILRNTSMQGVGSVFASLDMASTRIYEKILYKLTGKSREEIYELYKQDQEEELIEKINDNFKNVFFYDKSQPTVQDIKNYILECEKVSGTKIKLVMIDYFERIYTDVADSTSASKKVAGDLQDLVNDLNICLITLVQPNKMSGDMSKPINSYSNIKGSSFLAQSFRIIMGIYREGFSPQNSENDKYLTVSVLKNDLGEPGSFDFRWNGKRGEIYEMDEYDRVQLDKLRNSNRDADDDW